MFLEIKSKYAFGKKAIKALSPYLKKHQFQKALLLFGASSAKKNGSYDDVIEVLQSANMNFVEFWGIEPNPQITTVDQAVALGQKNQVDLIIAVGSGSVIDAAKVIGFLIVNNHWYSDSWEYLTKGVSKDLRDQLQPVPKIVSVLTIAGTGSESNAGSVISSEQHQQKIACHNQLMIPELAILDPQYTYTVSDWQLASAGFDCLAHLLEIYLGDEPCFGWHEEYLFANMRTIIKYLPIALQEPKNYDAKANVMWTASFSLNALATMSPEGYNTQDFKVHLFEHALSAVYDVTHGAGLSLLYPTYLKIMHQTGSFVFVQKWTKLSQKVFGVANYKAGVQKLEELIVNLKLPTKLSDFQEIKSYDSQVVQTLVDHVAKDVRFLSSVNGELENILKLSAEVFEKLKF